MSKVDTTEEFTENNLQGMLDKNAKRKLAIPVVYTGLLLGLIPEFRGYKPEELFKKINIQSDGHRDHLSRLNTMFKIGDKECKLDVNYLIAGLPYKYADGYLEGPCADIGMNEVSEDIIHGNLYLPSMKNTSISLCIYWDIEPQNKNHGLETILKRGKFYNSQNISAHVISGEDAYTEIGKAYSLWLCTETNSKMNFIDDSGVYRSLEIAGNYDIDKNCLSNIKNTNLEEVIIVSLPKLLKKYEVKKSKQDQALYKAMKILVDMATDDDATELSKIYNTKLVRKEGEIMGEIAWDYIDRFVEDGEARGEARGEAKGKEEGITAAIGILQKQGFDRKKIENEILEAFGDTNLVKEVLKKNNV